MSAPLYKDRASWEKMLGRRATFGYGALAPTATEAAREATAVSDSRKNVRPLGDDHDRARMNEALAQFVEDGLLWLVNTSVLHPRGYALGVLRDTETKEPYEIVLLGDGSEPWFFEPGEFDEIISRYERGEERRSRAWDPDITDDDSPVDYV